jgi:5-(carboxyamino)imidazole ribonucleotide mutase
MPPGIPVATVAINGAQNAGILAAQILGASDEAVYTKVQEFKKELEKTVEKKAEKLEDIKYAAYLKDMGK